MTRRWKSRPNGSNWGEFGDDDQIGRLNLITNEVRLRAAAEIRQGKCFCLSLPLDFPGGSMLAPHRFPPQINASQRHGQSYFNYPLSNEGAFGDCGCDDSIQLTYYNGHIADIEVIAPAARGGSPGTRLGIENMAETCIQGRGVLVDLAAHVGRERQRVGYDGLMHIIDAQRVAVERGDMLCLYTGFADVVLEMNRQPDQGRLAQSYAVLDGADDRLLQWISGSGIAAMIADNYAVEAIPSRPRGNGDEEFVPLHVHCLFKLGLPLGELWYLAELANWLRANNRHRFFLTAPPLRLPGAAGSPVTPVATV
jgi:kynurenine formamidase